jgi:hypothetical protein
MSDAPRKEPRRAPGSDFLARVVDSVFGRGSRLEPRLPSRFEPHTFAAATVTWPAEFARTDGERIASAQIEDRPERERHRQTVPRDAPASREDPQVGMDPPDASTPRAALALALARPHDEDTDRDVLTPMLPGPLEAGRDRRAETAHEPQRAALDSPSGVLRAQRVISTTETTDQSMGVRAPENREASPRSSERSVRWHDHPMAPVPQMHGIVVEPATARHRPARDPLHAETAKAGSEPVVNVTIGRIEVRAVPAQSGSTRQRSEGPKPMSLDDYLRQREGGR